MTLASDLNKQTAKDYGVLLDDLIGLGSVSARAAFVIDKEGTVQYAEQTETPLELPNFDAVKKRSPSLTGGQTEFRGAGLRASRFFTTNPTRICRPGK